MALVTYLIVRTIYPVRYEWDRMLKIAGGTALCIILYYSIPINIISSNIVSFGWRILLLILFVTVIFILKFFKGEESQFLKDLIWKSRGIKSSDGQDQGPGYNNKE
jgi:hypothetical protein